MSGFVNLQPTLAAVALAKNGVMAILSIGVRVEYNIVLVILAQSCIAGDLFFSLLCVCSM